MNKWVQVHSNNSKSNIKINQLKVALKFAFNNSKRWEVVRSFRSFKSWKASRTVNNPPRWSKYIDRITYSKISATRSRSCAVSWLRINQNFTLSSPRRQIIARWWTNAIPLCSKTLSSQTKAGMQGSPGWLATSSTINAARGTTRVRCFIWTTRALRAATSNPSIQMTLYCRRWVGGATTTPWWWARSIFHLIMVISALWSRGLKASYKTYKLRLITWLRSKKRKKQLSWIDKVLISKAALKTSNLQ